MSLHRALSRALYRLGSARLFRFYSRSSAEAVPSKAGGGADLKWLSEKELHGLSANAELDLTPEKIGMACARGDLCAAAYVNERLAGYCWFSTAPLPHMDGVWVEYSPQVLWIYKSFVLPAYRGRGIAPALYGLASDLARGRDCTASLICVESHNAASVAAARRAAHLPAGMAAYRVTDASVAAWYGGALRAYGVRFYRPPSPSRTPNG